jgi:hypothetical protein
VSCLAVRVSRRLTNISSFCNCGCQERRRTHDKAHAETNADLESVEAGPVLVFGRSESGDQDQPKNLDQFSKKHRVERRHALLFAE